MLIIAVGLTVALVAADILSLASRPSSAARGSGDKPLLTDRSALAERARDSLRL